MQAPFQQQLQPSLSTTTRQLPHNLPSPDSDLDSTSMVILPSSPSSAIANSPSTTTTTTTNDTDSQPTPMVVPAKRGYKSHVPSACVNCKKAHLACDVSRPCKRCVASGKASTCQDVQHKKRGRPKLNDTKRLNIMYGGSMIIQTPASIMQKNTPSTSFSFVHEPVESFRSQQQEITLNRDDLPRKGRHESSPIPSTPTQQPLPSQQQSPSPQQQQQPSSSFSSPALSFVTTTSSLPAIPSSSSSPLTITMFLSMEMCCARVSEETKEAWGYDPKDLAHRSLYGLISSHDTDRLARLHRLLLDNIMDITRQYGKDFRSDARPPPSERTTSPLFHQIEPEKLMIPARGSEMFMDTIHVKKQSGDYELYQMQVSLGAGLGADLTRPSTLNKLYIVAELRKHEYRVRTPYQLDQEVIHHRDSNNSNNNRQHISNNRRPLSKFQALPSNSSSNHINNNTSQHSSYHRPLMPRPLSSPSSRSGPLQVRQGLLPGHFTTNSQLNTVTLSAKKLDIMPKVNVAPVTADRRRQPMENKVADRLFPSLNGSYFRQIASNADTTRRQSGGTGGNGTSSTTPIHVSPGLSYRLPPNSAGGSNTPTIPPRRVVPSVTHPTTQYFLQTSSSTLNAAASAAQRTMKQTSIPELESSTAAAAVGKTDSNRKTEMSVRSLLC